MAIEWQNEHGEARAAVAKAMRALRDAEHLMSAWYAGRLVGRRRVGCGAWYAIGGNVQRAIDALEVLKAPAVPERTWWAKLWDRACPSDRAKEGTR